MKLALDLARRAYGFTSPNPMVGAVLVKAGRIIGRGWHHRAGEPHAEIEALRDARRRDADPRGGDLYVTLEPCCTHGRTGPCTDAIIASGIQRVFAGATDPNPRHRGKGFAQLRQAGIEVVSGLLEADCEELNAAFNHWIVHRTPLVTVKAAMSLDGKIALASGDSKWITGEKARAYAMHLRLGSDAMLVGVNTILVDDPSLTYRPPEIKTERAQRSATKSLRRIVVDSLARTPLHAKVVSDGQQDQTLVFVSKRAPAARLEKLRKKVEVIVAPTQHGRLDLRWVLQELGKREVTSLLVEGGGEVNASFLLGGLAQRVAFFYAPKVLGGRDSHAAVAGDGVPDVHTAPKLREIRWRKLGEDLLMEAAVGPT